MSERRKRLKKLSLIKVARRQLGQTQVEFAESLGVSQALISDYENGWRRPSPEHAVRLASLTGINRDYFIFDDADGVVNIPKSKKRGGGNG